MKKIKKYEADISDTKWRQIQDHPSFRNMGKALRLRGADHAFMYKGELYRAIYFPNFGNSKITWWKDNEKK